MDRFIDVELDRPRRLRLTVPALREVKRRAGLSLAQLFLGIGMLDVDAMAWLLWAAMRAEDPKATEEHANAAIQAYIDTGHDLEDLVLLLESVAERSGLLKASPAEPPGDPPQAPGTGPTLGATEPASVTWTTGSTSSPSTHTADSSCDPGTSTA